MLVLSVLGLSFTGLASLDILTEIALLLFLGAIMKKLSEYIRVPDLILLIAAGTTAVSLGVQVSESIHALIDVIRTIALIMVVFSAGFYLKVYEIKNNFKAIISLSSIGVIVTMAIISAVTYQVLNIPLITSLFIGAVLSGTALEGISSFLEKKRERILQIVASESILNSPLTIILPLVLLDFVSPSSRGAALLAFPKLAGLIVVGTIVGIIGAIAGNYLFKHIREREELYALTLALLVYVVSETLFGSGILSVAITSVFIGSKRLPKKREIKLISSEIAFIFIVIVYLGLGLEVGFNELKLLTRIDVIAVIGAIIAARLLASFVSLIRADLSFSEKLNIGLIGPKGLAAAAIAPLALSAGIIGADQAVRLIYVAIVFSVLVSLAVLEVGEAKEKLKKREERKKKRVEAKKIEKIEVKKDSPSKAS